MWLVQPEILAFMAEQGQQVPGQPLFGVQMAAGGESFDRSEQNLVQSL